MGSPQQYKYYRSMMEQFHMFFMGDLFLDTTVRLGPDKVIRCSRLALGKAAHDHYFGVRVRFLRIWILLQSKILMWIRIILMPI
jgi:hypothetical protein